MTEPRKSSGTHVATVAFPVLATLLGCALSGCGLIEFGLGAATGGVAGREIGKGEERAPPVAARTPARTAHSESTSTARKEAPQAEPPELDGSAASAVPASPSEQPSAAGATVPDAPSAAGGEGPSVPSPKPPAEPTTTRFFVQVGQESRQKMAAQRICAPLAAKGYDVAVASGAAHPPAAPFSCRSRQPEDWAAAAILAARLNVREQVPTTLVPADTAKDHAAARSDAGTSDRGSAGSADPAGSLDSEREGLFDEFIRRWDADGGR